MDGIGRLAALGLLLVLLSGFGRPAAADEPDIERGARLFLGCSGCHGIGDTEDRPGPDLAGLFGRRAGSLATYRGYSAAMQAAGFDWTEARLDAWLADPNGFLPGNIMSYQGLRSEQDRMDLIAWLRRETAR